MITGDPQCLHCAPALTQRTFCEAFTLFPIRTPCRFFYNLLCTPAASRPPRPTYKCALPYIKKKHLKLPCASNINVTNTRYLLSRFHCICIYIYAFGYNLGALRDFLARSADLVTELDDLILQYCVILLFHWLLIVMYRSKWASDLCFRKRPSVAFMIKLFFSLRSRISFAAIYLHDTCMQPRQTLM